MAFLSSLDIAVSGLMAQRLRMDIISQNVNNAVTTRTEDGTPYVRQVVVFTEDTTYDNLNIRDFVKRKTETIVNGNMPFSSVLQMNMSDRRKRTGNGVVVTEIVEDETPLTPVYDPSHPDADEDGYYYLPNVDVAEEQYDWIEASNSYTASLTIFNSAKKMAQRALSIGK